MKGQGTILIRCVQGNPLSCRNCDWFGVVTTCKPAQFFVVDEDAPTDAPGSNSLLLDEVIQCTHRD
jgi:hypothetical protein